MLRNKLENIKNIVDLIRKNSSLEFEDSDFPSYGNAAWSHSYFVNYRLGYYSLFIYEENCPYDEKQYRMRVRTNDVDEIIFNIFREATRRMASEYALEHLYEYEDMRIPLFNKHVDLLKGIGFEQKYIDALRDEYDSYLHGGTTMYK